MQNWTCVVTAVALALCVAVSGHGDEPKKADDPKGEDKKVKELMHRKLEASQKVLEGLVMNDLDKVIKNAEELTRVRKEASFRIIKTAEYELWSDEFNRSIARIPHRIENLHITRSRPVTDVPNPGDIVINTARKILLCPEID